MPPRGDREAFEVHLDATELGAAARVGVLRRDAIRTDLPASFEYDPAWLAGGRGFILDPRLQLWGGEQYPPRHSAAFGVFLDSAPDRWGRLLMERREAARAGRERRSIRALQEMDFLLGVHDLPRSGALRLRSAAGGPFLDDSADAAPPFTSLRELARLSQRVEEPGVEKLPEYERWLAVLVAPGSSLGGARPKASFTDAAGTLWIGRLSPAYDMNPNPGKSEHALALDEGSAAPDLGALLATADLYRLDDGGARRVVDEVREAVGRWRDEAKRAGLPSGEIARMASAFAL